MEWMVPVNEMLKEEITKLNSLLIPPGFQGDVRSVRVIQDSLSKLIDQLGEQSAQAQGLNKVITTAEKLRNSPAYTLYLLKDASAKGGKGDVIGLLKVGRKHLFLFDERERVREVEPLCVLDFFVLGDRQRHGYGRKLFDYMLKDMETSAHLLAIDGPSPKMEQFLMKSYGMSRLVRQNNNFAVSPQFFGSTVDEISKSGCSTPASTPAAGRFSAPKPHSAIANVIHGGETTHTNGASPVATPEGERQEETAAAAAAAPQPAAAAAAVAPQPATDAAAAAGPAPEEHRSPERPCTLRVETTATPAAAAPSPAAPSPAGSMTSRRDSQLTDKGFFDVKFYHNKLW